MTDNDWLVRNLLKAARPLHGYAGEVLSEVKSERDGVVVFHWPRNGISDLQWVAFCDAMNKIISSYKEKM